MADGGVDGESEISKHPNDSETISSNYNKSTDKKNFFTSFSGNTELQLAIFRYLARDRDRRPSSFTQHDREIEKTTLEKICKMLIALYRYVSGLAAKEDDHKVIHNRTTFTLASVAKDVEKSRFKLQFADSDDDFSDGGLSDQKVAIEE